MARVAVAIAGDPVWVAVAPAAAEEDLAAAVAEVSAAALVVAVAVAAVVVVAGGSNSVNKEKTAHEMDNLKTNAPNLTLDDRLTRVLRFLVNE